MRGFFESFLPLLETLKEKYKIEVFLLTIAFIIACFSGIFLIGSYSKVKNQDITVVKSTKSHEIESAKIFVDLAGSVENPSVYEITSGARLKDILILSGGLSANADRGFFSRNFNLASKLSDQEKIYIPSIEEVQAGVFSSEFKLVENTTNQLSYSPQNSSQTDPKISINKATIEELDGLAGVGRIIGQKIIENRPYGSLDELVNKKVINKNLFEKIKNYITI